MLGGIKVGDMHPVRLMAVINLSQESFYKGSVVRPSEVLSWAGALVDQGADMLDIGAVSTAPGSPRISESLEMERLLPALKTLRDGLAVPVSVDTQRSNVAAAALDLGAQCVNDVSGLGDPEMAKVVAKREASLIIMASRSLPGDILRMDEVINNLGERLSSAIAAGVSPDEISLDPGIGRWVPDKGPEFDLASLDGLRRLRVLERPVVAAVSRKSFLGTLLSRPDPADRLFGSLAATSIAVYNGAHIVRTHDVSSSIDAIKIAEAARGKLAVAVDGEISVEVLDFLGQGQGLIPLLRRTGVDEGGVQGLCSKGAFRVLMLHGISSMEALVIKQEMLARGGDAAIPRLALRCDPLPEDVLVLGTESQIRGLVRNLKLQPFRLPAVGEAIAVALSEIDNPERYR
jgi:dihydropteroate synthase